MIDVKYSLLLIAVVSFVTCIIRFLPFILFRKKTPSSILYLGGILQYAIIAMLVVYCLREVSFLSTPHGIPEAVSVTFVVLLHKWKHNTLLSILSGTAVYMLILQFLF